MSQELDKCTEFNSNLLEEKARLNKINYDLQIEIANMQALSQTTAPPRSQLSADENGENDRLRSSLEILREELASVKEEMESENTRLQLLVSTLNRQIEQLQRNENLINISYEKEVSS